MSSAAISDAYKAFGAADEAWSALLRKHFGKQAGDVRYTKRGKGEPGSDLRAAHDEFVRTNNEWFAAMGRTARFSPAV